MACAARSMGRRARGWEQRRAYNMAFEKDGEFHIHPWTGAHLRLEFDLVGDFNRKPHSAWILEGDATRKRSNAECYQLNKLTGPSSFATRRRRR